MTAKKRGKGERDPREYLMSIGRGRAYVGTAIDEKEKEFAESLRLIGEDPSSHTHRCSTCDVWFPYRETDHVRHEVLPCVQCLSPRDRSRLLNQYLGGALKHAILARELARCRPGEEPAGKEENWEGVGQWFELPLEELIRRRGPEVLLDWRPWYAICQLSRAATIDFSIEGPPLDAARLGLSEKTAMSPTAREARTKLQRIYRALTALKRRRPARTFSDEKVLLRLRELRSQGVSRVKAVSQLEGEFGRKLPAIEQALSRAARSEKKHR